MKTTARKILIASRHSSDSYSGGRYHAWMMTEALAAAGHDVTVWTTEPPLLQQDFTDFPGHDRIRLHVDARLDAPPAEPFDVVIVVPHTGQFQQMYVHAIRIARERGARLVLLNFESGNWFNAYSPNPRSLDNWEGWKLVAEHADVVLSSAAESTRWAHRFYRTPRHCLFRHCHPAINTLVADAVPQPPRRRRIICLTRFGDASTHKGGGDLERALCPAMRGHELALIVGSGKIDETLYQRLEERAAALDIELTVARQLDDRAKFELIKSASLMLFLSYFEGFGYPPIEAQYCGVPCIVYELPVLREVSGEGLRYVPPGDTAGLQRAVTETLADDRTDHAQLTQRIAPVARFESYRDQLAGLIEEVTTLAAAPASRSADDAHLQQWLAQRRRGEPAPAMTFARRIYHWTARAGGRLAHAIRG